MTDAVQCTYEDARRNHLHDGIALSTAAKVAYFEEMVMLATRVGARDRLAVAERIPGQQQGRAEWVNATERNSGTDHG